MLSPTLLLVRWMTFDILSFRITFHHFEMLISGSHLQPFLTDEVHERHLDTDILLAILKETRPPHLRVVLMSATMDADRFAAYWGTDTPRMHIPGFTHPVKDYVLEDVLELTGYIPPKKGKKKKKFNNWNNSNGGGRKKTAWNDSELSDDDGDAIGGDENPAEESGNSIRRSSFVPDIPIEDLVNRVNNNEIDYVSLHKEKFCFS